MGRRYNVRHTKQPVIAMDSIFLRLLIMPRHWPTAIAMGILYLFCSHHRKPDYSGYTLRFEPLPDDFASLDDVASATIVNQFVADHIRIDPSQYYWFHRRFKTQPSLPRAALY